MVYAELPAEQSFLFQIYNSLTEGAMPCAGQCGQTFQRSLVDFFPLFVRGRLEPTNLSQLSSNTPHTSRG